jgi:hypothetical protein
MISFPSGQYGHYRFLSVFIRVYPRLIFSFFTNLAWRDLGTVFSVEWKNERGLTASPRPTPEP